MRGEGFPEVSPGGETLGGRRPRLSVVLAGVLVVGLVVVGVFGGYSQRTDQRIDLEVGVVVSLNHAEVRIISASVRHRSSDDGYSEIIVLADVRNISDLPLGSDAFRSAIGFGYVNDEGESGIAQWVRMSIRLASDSTERSPRGQIIPGGDFMPVVFSASVQDSVDARQGLRVALVPVKLEATSLFEISPEKEWVAMPLSHYWRLSLPLDEVI